MQRNTSEVLKNWPASVFLRSASTSCVSKSAVVNIMHAAKTFNGSKRTTVSYINVARLWPWVWGSWVTIWKSHQIVQLFIGDELVIVVNSSHFALLHFVRDIVQEWAPPLRKKISISLSRLRLTKWKLSEIYICVPWRWPQTRNVVDLHFGLFASHQDQPTSWENCHVIQFNAALNRSVSFARLTVPYLHNFAVHTGNLKILLLNEINWRIALCIRIHDFLISTEKIIFKFYASGFF